MHFKSDPEGFSLSFSCHHLNKRLGKIRLVAKLFDRQIRAAWDEKICHKISINLNCLIARFHAVCAQTFFVGFPLAAGDRDICIKIVNFIVSNEPLLASRKLPCAQHKKWIFIVINNRAEWKRFLIKKKKLFKQFNNFDAFLHLRKCERAACRAK